MYHRMKAVTAKKSPSTLIHLVKTTAILCISPVDSPWVRDAIVKVVRGRRGEDGDSLHGGHEVREYPLLLLGTFLTRSH